MRNRWTWVIVVLLVLVILGVCGSTLYRQQTAVLLRGFEPSCVVGIGTSSITVQAWSANDDCQAMVSGQDNFTGVNWLKLAASPVSESTGTIMCEMDIDGRHVTVRDSTPVSNNGTITCGILNGTIPNGVLPQ